MKLDKKKTIVANIALSLMELIVSIFAGAVLSFGWNTFIAPTFGIATLSLPVAVAILFLYEFLKLNISKQYIDNVKNQKLGIDKIEMAVVTITAGLMMSFYVWIVLFVLSLFI